MCLCDCLSLSKQNNKQIFANISGLLTEFSVVSIGSAEGASASASVAATAASADISLGKTSAGSLRTIRLLTGQYSSGGLMFLNSGTRNQNQCTHKIKQKSKRERERENAAFAKVHKEEKWRLAPLGGIYRAFCFPTLFAILTFPSRSIF